MMTMTQTPASFGPEFEVTLDNLWAGRVWSNGVSWTAQFDGVAEEGFDTMFEAARFVVQMRGAMR